MRRLLVAALLAAAVPAGAEAPFARTETRTPCAVSDPLRRPFFGDVHVHTALSLDAATQGVRSGPREAYRFARGEPLGIPPYDANGTPLRSLRLSRPLDFAAVTDHAELFGERTICESADLPGRGSPVCVIFRRWPRLAYFFMNGRAANTTSPGRYGFCGAEGAGCRQAARTPWTEIQAAAEAAYDRTAACRFTTFVGYEWTSSPGGNNLHRNVIFRNAEVPELPASTFEAPTPDALWEALRVQCLDAGKGCDALTIPHNSNLSGGLMFTAPPDADFARRRAAMEPLVEVMQHKGDSECAPGAGAPDELCGFEKLPYQNFTAKYLASRRAPAPPASFVRNTLGLGLVEQGRLAANPFKFGFIAGTDTHIAAAGGVEERGHPGHGGAGVPTSGQMPVGLPDDVELNPGGLAVLWAEENSRDALFAAMRRREAYGTSGPRVVVRFFGGWRFGSDLCDAPDLVAQGYAGGVPMGGDLPTRPVTGPPSFVVSALRDPGVESAPGALIQRVQIVKVWLEDGAARERVYDVAGDAANGATVDEATCQPRGPGATSLCTVWSDPDFDATRPALWYARVLENPTCRWSTYVCNAHRVRCDAPETIGADLASCCDPRYPRTIQERAWTSPVWYTP